MAKVEKIELNRVLSSEDNKEMLKNSKFL